MYKCSGENHTYIHVASVWIAMNNFPMIKSLRSFIDLALEGNMTRTTEIISSHVVVSEEIAHTKHS